MGEEQLNNILRQLRGKMSLREAAELSGLSHSYIRDLELGFNRSTKSPVKPSPDTLMKLATAYNFSYWNLLQMSGYLEMTEEQLMDYEVRRIDELQTNTLKDVLEKIMSFDDEQLIFIQTFIQHIMKSKSDNL